MNKQTFLDELNRLTASLSPQERDRLLDYYREMIEDRVEDGILEEEAVAALGDPADIAREFANTAQAAPRDASQTVSQLRHLRVRVLSADVAIVCEPLSNGAAAQLRFSDPTRFTWRMDGDTLVVEEPIPQGGHRGLRWLRQVLSVDDTKATVVLGDALPGDLTFNSGSGGLELEAIQIGGEALLHSGSGNMKLKHASFAGGLEATSGSGDMRMDDLRLGGNLSVKTSSGDAECSGLVVSGELRLETASGDVELRGCEAGRLTAVAASGDIEVDRCRMDAASIHATSGDVRLDELENDQELTAKTTSGDIDLTRCIARRTQINTASGDVGLRLEPLPCGYDISTNTVSGSIEFDEACAGSGDPQPKISIRTVSGDITARLA